MPKTKSPSKPPKTKKPKKEKVDKYFEGAMDVIWELSEHLELPELPEGDSIADMVENLKKTMSTSEHGYWMGMADTLAAVCKDMGMTTPPEGETAVEIIENMKTFIKDKILAMEKSGLSGQDHSPLLH